MKLVIMRHGQAELFREPDETRALTALGEQQVSDAGSWLAEHIGANNSIDLALISPYVRAQQTYEQLISKINVLKKIVTQDVVPDGSPALVHDYIVALKQQTPSLETILIVSHMPFVSYFLEEIHQEGKTILFDTASIVTVDYDFAIKNGVFGEAFHP